MLTLMIMNGRRQGIQGMHVYPNAYYGAQMDALTTGAPSDTMLCSHVGRSCEHLFTGADSDLLTLTTGVCKIVVCGICQFANMGGHGTPHGVGSICT